MTIDPLVAATNVSYGYCPCGEGRDGDCECGITRLYYAQGIYPPERARHGPTCVFCGEERAPQEFEDGLRCVYCREIEEDR